MVDSASAGTLKDRIAIVSENIRNLVEQAAAFSGASDEERSADCIAEQQELLDELLKQQAALQR